MTGYLYRGSPELERINAAIMADRAAGLNRPARLAYVEHGTPAGYMWHRRHGKRACDACRAAENARTREKSGRIGRPDR